MKVFVAVVLLNYALRLTLAAALALPVAGVVNASGVANFPAGDRILFESSGLYLAELLRLAGPELSGLVESSLWLLPLIALVLLGARAVSFAALSLERLELGAVVERARGLLPGYLLIAGLALLGQILLVVIGLWLAAGAASLFSARSERTGDLAFLAVASLGLLLVLALGCVAELSRARLAHQPGSALDAVADGFSLLLGAPGRVLSRFAGYGAAGLALTLLSSLLTEAIDVGREGSLRLSGVFLQHQLVALLLLTLHTAWLTAALGVAQEPKSSR